MLLNEQGFWRLGIATMIGIAAAIVAAALQQARKEPAVPLAAGITAAVTAYAIDVYTERRGHGE